MLLHSFTFSRMRRAMGALAVLLAGAATSAEASRSAAIRIPAEGAGAAGPASPNPSSVSVVGAVGTIERVTVTLHGFTHKNPDDVDIILVGPNGRQVVILSDAGGIQPADHTLTFFDQAPASAPDAGGFSGSCCHYRPTNIGSGDVWPGLPSGTVHDTLNAAFNGISPNGTWSLYVVDDHADPSGLDVGAITGGWSISFVVRNERESDGFVIEKTEPLKARPFPRTINVQNAHARLQRLGVVLEGLTAGVPENLDVLVQGPTGDSVMLLSGAGAHHAITNRTLTFAHGLMLPAVQDESPIESGTYRPTDHDGPEQIAPPGPAGPYGTSLGVFGGTNPNGPWRLFAQRHSFSPTPIADEVLLAYLAEGATGSFFDFEIALANPNAAPAPVVIDYLREDGNTVTQPLTLAARSRTTVRVDDLPGLESTSASAVIRSTAALPLVVERTMRWDGSGYGGHGGQAVTGPRARWLFAEGAQGFFHTYLLLANSSGAAVTATVSFLRESGGTVTRSYELAPTSRTTIYAGDLPELAHQTFGIVVDASAPIFAERSMYFSGERFFEGGHESPGVNEPSTSWFLAEGATGPFFQTYILVANPNAAPAHVHFRYLLSDGQGVDRDVTIGPESRYTVTVDSVDPLLANAAVSTVVTADVPVIVERAMYWPDVPWREAHNSFGLTSTALRWGLAEGRAGGPNGYSTYILLANPSAQEAADATVTFLREQGAPVIRTFTLAPASRFTIDVNAMAPELNGQSFGVTVEVTNNIPIAVERALYWNANGEVWTAGTGVVAVPLP